MTISQRVSLLLWHSSSVTRLLLAAIIVAPIASQAWTSNQSATTGQAATPPTTVSPATLDTRKPAAPAANAVKPATPTPSTAPPPATPSLASKLISDINANGDTEDYVPCEFSQDALIGLRPAPPVIRLTAADEDALRSQVIAEAEDSSNAKAFPQGEIQKQYFVSSVAQASFEGLTQSEAMGKVISLLWTATQPDTDATALIFASQGNNETFADFVARNYNVDRAQFLASLGSVEQPPQAKIQLALKFAENQKIALPAPAKDLATAASQTVGDLATIIKAYGTPGKAIADKISSSVVVAGTHIEENESPAEKLDAASKLAAAETVAETSNNPKVAASQVDEASKAKQLQDDLIAAKKYNAFSTLEYAAQQTTAANTGKPAQNQIVQSAQQATARLTRPPDVGCSMSVLSYQTARFAFGTKVADEFIPVQIVVRNLNTTKEFLVHDAEVAVDSDINGLLGRFSSGTDKLTTRTYMLSSKDASVRTRTLNILQGIGTIVSSASLVSGVEIKDASSVYNAGFLLAMNTILPDHSTDQLNLLNDEGFSSYRTERTVVPKSGTAEFVIFIPSSQFDEGWWVQDCAENIVINNPQNLQSNPKKTAQCIGQFNLASPNPKCINSSQTQIGIDLDDARRVCAHVYNTKPNTLVSGCTDEPTTSGCEPQLVNVPLTPPNSADDPDVTGYLAYFKPKTVAYKRWSPRAKAIFRELALAVVAGTHIEEESDTKSALTKIDCPVDDKGDVDFDKADGGNITCTLTGTNLDKVRTVKLRNSSDATDSKTASGPVTTNTNDTSKTTKVVFTLDSLGALTGTLYKVLSVTSDGVEVPGDQLLHFSNQPYLPASGKPTPASVDLAQLQKDKAGTPIKLAGYHLDQAKGAQLTAANAPTSEMAFSADSTATAATFTLTSDILKAAKIAGSDQALKITLVPKTTGAATIESKQTLSLTGAISAVAPPKKPAAAAKPSKKNPQ